MTATSVGLPTDEDPDLPAGPPVYSWDVEQGWWKCLLCGHIATRSHITSRRHRHRYSEHLESPVVLGPAQPRPDQAAPAGASGGGNALALLPPPPPVPAQPIDGQSPVVGPAPAPLWTMDEEWGIQQDAATATASATAMLQSSSAPTSSPFHPDDSGLPQVTSSPVSPPTVEDPDRPAGPPVYTWDVGQGWWRCLLCKNIATPLHITSQRHRGRYSAYLEGSLVLPPAEPRPDQAARAEASGSGNASAPPPPPPPLPAQPVDGQSPVAAPAPAPLRAMDEAWGIRQEEEAVDRLVYRLAELLRAELLREADGVLADIVHARRAGRRTVDARRPPSQAWQSQYESVRHRWDEPQQPQAPSGGGGPRWDQALGEAPRLADGHGPSRWVGQPPRRQNGRWHPRWWWRDAAQADRISWWWDEWTDAGQQ